MKSLYMILNMTMRYMPMKANNKWDRRDKKLAKRKKMTVDGKSVFIIEQELAKRAKIG